MIGLNCLCLNVPSWIESIMKGCKVHSIALKGSHKKGFVLLATLNCLSNNEKVFVRFLCLVTYKGGIVNHMTYVRKTYVLKTKCYIF